MGYGLTWVVVVMVLLGSAVNRGALTSREAMFLGTVIVVTAGVWFSVGWDSVLKRAESGGWVIKIQGNDVRVGRVGQPRWLDEGEDRGPTT